MLSLETASEADWAGGVPLYLLWSLGGIHALAAVPLLAACGLLIFVRRTRPGRPRLEAVLLLLPLLLWTLRDGLQPVPLLFDLLGLVVLWTLLELPLQATRRLLLTLVTFAIWASLGPGPIWGLLLIVTRDGFPQPAMPSGTRRSTVSAVVNFSPRLWLQVFGAALLGGMLTPRGPLGWRDSVLMFAPSAFGSQSPSESPGIVVMICLCLLWCLWMLRNIWLTRRPHGEFSPGPLRILSWSIPLLAAWLSPENIPVSGLWMLLDFLQFEVTAETPQSRLHIPASKVTVPAIAILLLGAALVDATGRVTAPGRRLGWGIAQELDHRLLDARLFSIPDDTAIAWAPDGRSVGVVTWLDGHVQLADHPQRAFLGGRQHLHAALVRDLLGAHRARYRLDDGSWGGWVHQLKTWNIALLMLPVEQQALSRALKTTPWTPADLDSPTIPFVSGEDLRFASVVLESLQQQDFVDAGPWQPAAEIYSGQGWRIDVVELLGGGPDPAPAIRQAQLFRSLSIPMAALRSLQPIRQLTAHPGLTSEFRTCITELAYREWLTSGETSEFRSRVLSALRPAGDAVKPFLSTASTLAVDDEMWNRCTELYLQGQLDDAASSLPLDSAQQHYAAAMIWIELGDTDRALQALEQVLTSSDSKRSLIIAAHDWQQQLQPPERP